jgi:hypothetical protein
MPYGAAAAASNYRATTEAQSVIADESAEDAENLRQIFVEAFGQPRITIASGFSFGGLVTAKLIELYGTNSDGTQNYDGAFAACGVLGGMTQLGYVRLDSRVVYQYYCQNHPRPDEVQYPLYLGLAPGQMMTPPELQARVNECTGIQLPPEQRSETQQQNLANILSVVRIPDDALPFLMNFGTFTFQYLVQDRLEGRNPFPNRHVRYVGSSDDLALNQNVTRYTSDRQAAAWLASSGDLTGDISIPVLTMHGIDDGRVFVENEATYRETLEAAGTSGYLVQTFNNTSGHCTFSAPENVANLVTLLSWIEKGVKPTRESIAEECENWRPLFGGECRFNNEYEPQPLATRVYPRHPHHKQGVRLNRGDSRVNTRSIATNAVSATLRADAANRPR